jgi:hypothetical protein
MTAVDQRLGIEAHLAGFRAKTLMGSVAIAAVRAWHMLGDRRWTMPQGAVQIRSDALAAEEDLDRSRDDPCLDFLIVLGNLDMVIKVHPAALPLGILVRFVRQGDESRSIELLKQLAPTWSLAI